MKEDAYLFGTTQRQFLSSKPGQASTSNSDRYGSMRSFRTALPTLLRMVMVNNDSERCWRTGIRWRMREKAMRWWPTSLVLVGLAGLAVR